ncbi:hypothetical protein [Halosolutus gelatinilyticus]|uniref:hypothetical protein n=1 Tax=Halosolutus gelatinilyticus TaxID=2931975 RepID=UPI001FF32E1D|nr:hypothetical protein [Halosolutus gelatinilyticus]
MSRMGAEGYSSAGQTRLSAKVDAKLKEDFKAACESLGETMTDVIEEQMQDVVSEYGCVDVDSRDDGYYPADPQLRELYEACLKYATEDLKIYQRRHAGSIAQETRQVSKNELPDALMPLRQQGFVALGAMLIGLSGEALHRWRNWYVKPPCADPKQWKYREGNAN